MTRRTVRWRTYPRQFNTHTHIYIYIISGGGTPVLEMGGGAPQSWKCEPCNHITYTLNMMETLEAIGHHVLPGHALPVHILHHLGITTQFLRLGAPAFLPALALLKYM